MQVSFKRISLMLIVLLFALTACDTTEADTEPTQEGISETVDDTDESDTETTDTTEETQEDSAETNDTGMSSNGYTITGSEVDIAIDGRSFSGDYNPFGNDFSAFDINISPDSGFTPALIIAGIPRSASEGDVITLGNPVTDSQACIFFQEGLDLRTSFTAISASGTLTLTTFDGTTASGTFEAVMVAGGSSCVDTVGEPGTFTTLTDADGETYTLTGTFTDVAIVEEE